MDQRESAQFRAVAGKYQGFGVTPLEALGALMPSLSETIPTPIVIWPYNQGDAFFTEAQQARMRELKSRRDTLTEGEEKELEELIAASFDATIARTQAMTWVRRERRNNPFGRTSKQEGEKLRVVIE